MKAQKMRELKVEAEMQKVPNKTAAEIRGEMDLMVQVAAQSCPSPEHGE